MGKPLVHQWVWDIVSAVDALAQRDDLDAQTLILRRENTTALTILFATDLDECVSRTICDEALTPYYTIASLSLPTPVFIPKILNDADRPEISAPIAPRSLAIVNLVNSENEPITGEALSTNVGQTRNYLFSFSPVTVVPV